MRYFNEDFFTAEKILIKSSKNENDYHTLNMLGLISLKINEKNKAIEYFKEAIKHEENFDYIYYLLGNLYWESNSYEEAEKYMRLSIRQKKKIHNKFFIHLHYQFACFIIERNKSESYDEVKDYLLRIKENDPKIMKILLKLEELYSKNKNEV